MQVHTPDPAYTSSEQARANFRLAAKIALGFVALLWVLQLLNWGWIWAWNVLASVPGSGPGCLAFCSHP